MDKKNKLFFVVFFGLIMLSVAVTYYKYFISRNYYIQAEASCDPETEACFVYECDPEMDEACPEDEAERISFYKLIRKKAFAIPDCDPSDESCPPLACFPGEDCEETLCSEETAEEGISCNDPEEYLNAQLEEDAAAGEESMDEEEILEDGLDSGDLTGNVPGDMPIDEEGGKLEEGEAGDMPMTGETGVLEGAEL